MDKLQRHPYQQPLLKVVSFPIERGFNTSPDPQPSNFETMVPNQVNDDDNHIYSSLSGTHFQ